jgi:hypothetical protein
LNSRGDQNVLSDPTGERRSCAPVDRNPSRYLKPKTQKIGAAIGIGMYLGVRCALGFLGFEC